MCSRAPTSSPRSARSTDRLTRRFATPAHGASRRPRRWMDGGRRIDGAARCRRQRDRPHGRRRAAVRPGLSPRHRPERRALRRAARNPRRARGRRASGSRRHATLGAAGGRRVRRRRRHSLRHLVPRLGGLHGRLRTRMARPRRCRRDHARRRDPRCGRGPRGGGRVAGAAARRAISRCTSSRGPCSSARAFRLVSSPPSRARRASASSSEGRPGTPARCRWPLDATRSPPPPRSCSPSERVGRSTDGLVATVGALELSPNVGNVVPGEARMLLEVRHAEDAVRARAADAIRAEVERIASARGVDASWTLAVRHGCGRADTGPPASARGLRSRQRAIP